LGGPNDLVTATANRLGTLPDAIEQSSPGG
jgi:hypothetical protein